MKKIRNRIFFQILVPVLLFYSVVALLGIRFFENALIKQSTEQKLSDLELVTKAVDDWLITRVSEILNVGVIAETSISNNEDFFSFLNEWLRRNSLIYDRIYLIDLNGSFLSTDHTSGEIMEKDFISMYANEKRPFNIGFFSKEPEFSESIVISVPVKIDDYKSILAAVISIDTLERMLGFFTLGNFDAFMVVNPKSVIAAHSEDHFVGRSESEVYSHDFFTYGLYEDKFVFPNVLRTSWKLVVFYGRKNITEPVYRVTRIVGFLFLLLVVLIGAISYVITAFVVKPVRELKRGVSGIMEGDYRHRIRIKAEDEIGELAEAFNRLSERMIEIRTDDRFVFLGRFSARMAHEMRKPLNLIQLASNAMEVKKEYSETYLKLIKAEVENADRFISEILNFGKTRALNFTKYSLSALANRVIEKYRLITAENSIEITIEDRDGIPDFYFDIMKVEDVISNIFQNAIEAINGDEKAFLRKITLSLTRCDTNDIRMIITDTGPGFDDTSIDSLFDPYFTTKETGTGLGLAICYQIITAHGGRIELGNTEDHHGEVCISFPVSFDVANFAPHFQKQR